MQNPFWQAVKDVGLASMPHGSLQMHIESIRNGKDTHSTNLLARVMDGAPKPRQKRQTSHYMPRSGSQSSLDGADTQDTDSLNSYLGDLKANLTPRASTERTIQARRDSEDDLNGRNDRWVKPPPPPPINAHPMFRNAVGALDAASVGGKASECGLSPASPRSPVPPHAPPNLQSQDLYEILGIKKHEKIENIRKIFRALAREYHPDRQSNKDDDTAFKVIKEAHDILSNAQRRRFYDDTGFKCEEDLVASNGPNTAHCKPPNGMHPAAGRFGMQQAAAGPHSEPFPPRVQHMFGNPAPQQQMFPPLDPWSWMGEGAAMGPGMGRGMGPPLGGPRAHGFISLGGF